MVHIRDVWINWFEGEENGYNICEFFEWRKEDKIELLDSVIVIKLTSNIFDYIENNLAELPEQLLDDVYQQSYQRKNNQRLQLDYCFIVTDGKKVLAVDTLGYKTPIRKSRLMPRQEETVLELAMNEHVNDYYVEYIDLPKEHHILSPDPRLMSGLIRKERQLKQLLFMALDQLYSTGNVAEVRYWFTEWSPNNYESIQQMCFDEAWEKLFNEVKMGWTSQHYHLCERMVKGHSFFEKLWELQHAESVK
ncbi:hypothetical protein BKP37_18075 [Anaerobacillus alkalilacustris]|uniref:Uncharacterized protein n=1 Tax=Anaerobacillus alkalilacustris TaxID=393763 RepID=A0A1S2LDL4_9BACI|nr:YjbA family protein [Anaerobacillus alkalilacustris]OIJ10446.1 hypothetical protein BKP37_18075 [Anaerobacillus alkalilacustris]